MKKVKFILIFAFAMSMIFPVAANTQINIDDAEQTAVNFISAMEWNSSITKKELIYNDELQKIGYVYELGLNSKDGYVIVCLDENGYYVSEASIEKKSPYLGNDFSYNIYSSALEYSFKKPDNLLEFFADKYLNNNSLNNGVMILAATEVPYKIVTKTTYLSDYPTSFEKAAQEKVGQCIPFSTAMALQYLSNVDTIEFKTNFSSVKNIALELYSLMNCVGCNHGVTDATAKSGLIAFSKTNLKESLTFTSYWKNLDDNQFLYLDKFLAQINNNKPVVTIFNSGTLNQNYFHAAVAVGYKELINYYKTSNNTTSDYMVIVRDPGDSKVPEVVMRWNNTNIAGLFIINIK